MSNHNSKSSDANGKPAVTLVGKVKKIFDHGEPEKAQITVEKADELYRELRIPNVLENSDGGEVRLKEGADVDVVIEATPEGIEKKSA